MSIESTSTIAGLVATNPTPQDPVYQGPNHMWLIKSVLKNIFPGVGGQGFSKPITATEDELNRVKGVTSPLQAQINALQAQIDALENSGGGGGGGGTPIPEQWPIGSIFHCALATNPATLLGFGTWSRYGQGRMLISQSTSDSDFATAGSTGGSKAAVLLSHTHSGSAASASTSHSHSISSAADHTHTAGSGSMSANATHTHSGNIGNMSANASHGHSATVSVSGSHNHRLSGILTSCQANPFLQNIIQYSDPGGLQTQNAGEHTHTVTANPTSTEHTHSLALQTVSTDHTHSISVGAGGGHSHSVTADGSSHSHTLTINAAGVANASNMPPYVVVYMWQRVA
jgi:hypothetical protein